MSTSPDDLVLERTYDPDAAAIARAIEILLGSTDDTEREAAKDRSERRG